MLQSIILNKLKVNKFYDREEPKKLLRSYSYMTLHKYRTFDMRKIEIIKKHILEIRRHRATRLFQKLLQIRRQFR